MAAGPGGVHVKDLSKEKVIRAVKKDKLVKETTPLKKLTSTLKKEPVEERFARVNGGSLKDSAPPELTYLPLLEMNGFIVKGWSHAISASPKAGKTHLIASVIKGWNEKILYISEEPKSIWQERTKQLGGNWEHVEFVFPLGLKLETIIKGIENGDETVVVIDTLRSFLGLKDENDNAELAKALNPLIAVCRHKEQTLILVVHNRKAQGDHGEALAGGHALLGAVDLALEVSRESSKNRRRIRGWGRIIEIPEIIYEKVDDKLIVIGEPKDLALEKVMDKVLGVLEAMPGEKLKVIDIDQKMPEPKASLKHLRTALTKLFKDRKIERNPKEDRKGATYFYFLQPNLNHSFPNGAGKVVKEDIFNEFDAEKIPF